MGAMLVAEESQAIREAPMGEWDLKWRNLRGNVMLREYLDRHAKGASSPGERRTLIAAAQKRLAKALRTSVPTVYAWRVGFRRPGDDYQAALARICGIQPIHWRTKEERARYRRLRAA
jgi:peptidoglycan/xylan/chitin deacetylase (PgdA/CDA1 family)